MDPNIQNILCGVTANLLTATLSLVVKNGKESKKGKDTLNEKLKLAISSVSDTIGWSGEEPVEEICLFLLSPEVESVLRQLFCSKLLGDSANNAISSIEEEFCQLFAVFTEKNQEEEKKTSVPLFNLVASTCDEALNVAIEAGLLFAHEAKSNLRFNVLNEELKAISKNLNFLTGGNEIRIKDIAAFENKYRSQVSIRHSDIVPPNFDIARRIPIDSLYVAPQLLRVAQTKDDAAKPLTTQQILQTSKRIVVLGNPGGGKSTLAQKLINDISKNYDKRLYANRLVTPILIVLRDYGALKKAEHKSIIEYIEVVSNSTYQVAPPKGAFEYLLLNGRLIVIFDGLDELLDTRDRLEISRDIEMFCALYPGVAVVVTSRQVGYEQAPLDENSFDSFLLEAFNDEQVKAYVDKFFAVDRYLTEAQQKQKASSFYQESRVVSDLCANPLMLALMCNIYRGENYIPANRPDVYEKCAVMLFERWDKNRGINALLPFETLLRPAMMYLAHWIYTDTELRSGVTEARLISKATEYLCPKRFEDYDEARRASADFIAFCHGRAWVFSDTGTTPDGESIYQFTHGTFLEYFAAYYMARTLPLPSNLLESIYPKIKAREWDVVAQLALQIQNKNIENAGDEFLNLMLDKSSSASDERERWIVLSFVARTLEFIVPSPATLKRVVRLYVDELVKYNLPLQTSKKLRNDRVELHEILPALLSTSRENQKIIAESLELYLASIAQTQPEGATIAYECLFHLSIALSTPRASRQVSRDVRQFWLNLSAQSFDKHWPSVSLLLNQSPRLSLDAFNYKKITLPNLLEMHGRIVAFQDVTFLCFPNVSSQGVAYRMLDVFLRVTAPQHLENINSHFEEIGRWVVKSSHGIPRGQSHTLRYAYANYQHERTNQNPQIELTQDAKFGLFCVIASSFSNYDYEREIELFRREGDTFIQEENDDFSKILKFFLSLVSSERNSQSTIDELIREFNFSDVQASVMRNWFSKTSVNLIKGHRAKLHSL